MRYHGNLAIWKDLLRTGLAEDDWLLDWTTQATVQPGQRLRASVIAKSSGVWVGGGLIAAANEFAEEQSGKGVIVSALADGATFKPGDRIARWAGPARLILALERPFLNLASYASGIATKTRELVDIVRKACPKNPPRVTSTRKTLPHYRALAVTAIRIGGGHSHRTSVSGGVLIKENHIASAGSIAKAVNGARTLAPHGLKIEIEVRNARELEAAIEAGADAFLLDNFSPAQIRAALKRLARKPGGQTIEVSGGISENNIAQYALPGVDVISVGSLTHSVRSADFSLLVRS